MANFRQQLGTIMEILTKAAVAEIVKLVDDGSAVLRLEMCRTQNENEALKTKIHQMENELGTAMGRRDKARTQEIYVNTRSVGVQVFEEFKEEKQSRIFGEELCINAWREQRQTGLNKDTLLQSLSATDNLVDVEEERSEPYNFIKQEMYEDTWWSSDPEGELEAGREEMSLQEHHCPENSTQTMPLKEPTVLSEQHKVGPSEQDLGTRQFPIKAEHWKGCALQKACQPEYEPRTGRGSCLSTEFAADEKGGQPWISFAPDGGAGPGESPERQPILSAQGALSLIPTAVNSCVSAPPSSAAGMRARVSSFESGPEGADLGTPPGCHVKPAPQTRQNPCGFRADATPLSRLQQFGQSINVMAARGDAGGLAFDALNGYGHALGIAGFGAAKAMRGSRKPCADDKQFRCAHCGRGFSRLTCLKIHQRSHTGEKPYSCVECGRRFTQQKSLKTHQSVHTGERPFSCSLCGKRFSRQDNCTRHERFHSGKKPFSCKQCGKCFTLQSNLKTHQQIHCGFNRLVCAQ